VKPCLLCFTGVAPEDGTGAYFTGVNPVQNKTALAEKTVEIDHLYFILEEKMEDLLKRITFKKDALCGKPLIRDLRISVELILELLAKGATEQEILEDYHELEPDDLRAALLYAHHMIARENVFDRVEARR